MPLPFHQAFVPSSGGTAMANGQANQAPSLFFGPTLAAPSNLEAVPSHPWHLHAPPTPCGSANAIQIISNRMEVGVELFDSLVSRRFTVLSVALLSEPDIILFLCSHL